MREKLNDNPLVQVALLGVLALIVGFLLITRMGGSSDEASTAAPAPTTATATDTTGTAVTPTPTAPATPVAPDGTVPLPPPATNSTFTAGPGLPKPVVDAYDTNRVVVLLVVNKGSIDDDKVKAIVETLKGESTQTSLFVVQSKDVADYSRIAQGVDLQQTPAIVVLRPKNLAPKGSEPTATISYGYRGPDSVAQTVADALYKGPNDLPYYPQ